MIPQKKPVNYLNNKDILNEIHLSKSSYCSFINPIYHRYDIIIDALKEELTQELIGKLITPEVIKQAKINKAKRLCDENDNKQFVTPDDIHNEDLTIRIMTWNHIPLSQKLPKQSKKKNVKDFFDYTEDFEEDLFQELEDEPNDECNDKVHVKLNFPPFQHYVIKDNSYICVGKSHWKGDLDTGSYSKDHGKITNKLAKMYMMMCERYSSKYNWRSYSYNEDMRSSALLQLTYVGLKFNEAKGDNPFSYMTQVVTNAFCRVLNSEKKNQNIRDDLLELNDLNPSYTRMSISNDSDYNDQY